MLALNTHLKLVENKLKLLSIAKRCTKMYGPKGYFVVRLNAWKYSDRFVPILMEMRLK